MILKSNPKELVNTYNLFDISGSAKDFSTHLAVGSDITAVVLIECLPC